MKLGLDFHGILDKYPVLFSELSHIFVETGSEVHIITGSMITPEFRASLDKLGIKYTHLFSIADYHVSIGTEVAFHKNGSPYLDGNKWDRTKAEYCERVGIDLHIDDSPEYGKYFIGKTKYLFFKGL
jgi:hypothetical protein